ncbi:uncharacterized protein LOC133311121 isoform X2 [Gastrolobium bilobum]|uniref:uncharacterized protein LOC133311121 isoform X2 n=1 Tax=Gastrolobium bilobum TaxID=150636 RepID=UPI002AB0A803|nr:uncharacterized protein LOC133311121 isoform X2 [Gastrolobium bilobum]
MAVCGSGSGGATYCGIASLRLMGFIEDNILSSCASSSLIDVPLLLDWILEVSFVKIIDSLYNDRHYARFFVLETIARVPYFVMAGVAPEGSQFDARQYDAKMSDLYSESMGRGCILASDVDSVILTKDACGGDGTLAFARSEINKVYRRRAGRGSLADVAEASVDDVAADVG